MNEDISLKEKALAVTLPLALTIGCTAYLGFVYDGSSARTDNDHSDAAKQFNPHSPARVVSESYGDDENDPSLELQQTLPSGKRIIIRKPVFIGEIALHDPGDSVVPSSLEEPLP